MKYNNNAIEKLILRSDSYYESAIRDLDASSYNRSVSTFYYTVFYLVVAVMITTDATSSKHSYVTSFFNKEFGKTGVLSKYLVSGYNRLAHLRDDADYDITIDISEKDAKETKEFVDHFRNEMKEQIKLRIDKINA